jgi:predicted ferric reductase
MLERSRELLFALVAIVFISILYFLMLTLTRGIPAASGFYGHGMGILGFVLMLMTETLYSLRKRWRNARWGKMARWLEFHIFTGIVGSYLVLLHSSWKFNGLAGVVMLLTGVVVASGFIGRYIYTAVPRSAEGVELSLGEIETRVVQYEQQIRLVSGQTLITPELRNLTRQRDRLRRQAASLITARRMLALWHAIHIPIGLALFALAFVHAGAAIYYASLLH